MTEDRKRCFALELPSVWRAQIYGIAALWVVASHAIFYNWVRLGDLGNFGKNLAHVMEHGNLGVDIFLLLSGVSLYFSLMRKHDFGGYVKRRLKRILPPFFLIVGPVAAYTFLIKSFDPSKFALVMTTVGFWVEGLRWGCWYVPAILFIYATYPFIHQFLFYKEDKVWVRYLLLMVLSYYIWWAFATYNGQYYWVIEIMLGRFPIFITGSFLGKYVYEKKHLPAVSWLVIIVFAFLFTYITDYAAAGTMWFRIGYIFGGISFSYLLAWVFQKLSQVKNRVIAGFMDFMALTGSISFELYLAHVMVFRLWPECNLSYSWILWIIATVGAWLWALGVKKFIALESERQSGRVTKTESPFKRMKTKTTNK